MALSGTKCRRGSLRAQSNEIAKSRATVAIAGCKGRWIATGDRCHAWLGAYIGVNALPLRVSVPPSYAHFQAALTSQYVIERELGRGGMATVYLARDLRHDRNVAIKVLRDEVVESLARDRFIRETQLAARLNHPHVLPLYD